MPHDASVTEGNLTFDITIQGNKFSYRGHEIVYDDIGEGYGAKCIYCKEQQYIPQHWIDARPELVDVMAAGEFSEDCESSFEDIGHCIKQECMNPYLGSVEDASTMADMRRSIEKRLTINVPIQTIDETITIT